jgi:hypothetical protein
MADGLRCLVSSVKSLGQFPDQHRSKASCGFGTMGRSGKGDDGWLRLWDGASRNTRKEGV